METGHCPILGRLRIVSTATLFFARARIYARIGTCWLSSFILALHPVMLYALPQDGQVATGSATITGGATNVDINQSTERAVINWGSFNVGGNESVNFYQPGATSITLNRVTGGGSASQILGAMNANGQVWLINPNGVVFGAGAQVDVGGLLATTSNISDSNFMAGNYRFDAAGNPLASISNAGSIHIRDGGLAALVGANVTNSGLIAARLGKVQLASGDTFALDLGGDGLINLQASGAIQQQLVQNSGSIMADGGSVLLTVAAAENTVNGLINMDGMIQANTVGEHNGEVTLYAEGSNAVAGNVEADKGQKTGDSTVMVSGTINAKGENAGEKGGTVKLLADQVAVMSGASIDASGQAGGGVVRVGGDYHGEGDTPTAKKVIVQEDTSIKANALDNGDGGNVTVWADDWTNYSGSIEAKGGVNGGDGGFIETSGKNSLSMYGVADASSAWGQAGVWLLDPDDLTVNGAADTNSGSSPNWVAGAGGGNVLNTNINTALNAGTAVTLTATGDITVSSAISKTAGADTTITLSAGNNITVNAAITSSNNKLGIVLGADNDASGAGGIKIGAALTSNGGAITMGGGADPTTTNAIGDATNVYGVEINGVTVDAGGGNIIMRGTGYANGSNKYGVYIHNVAVVQTSGAGTITMNGTGGGSGAGNTNSGIYINDAGTTVTVANGNLTLTGIGGNTSGNTNVGVDIGNSAVVESTGTGNISITGTGVGSGTSASSYGVYVESGGIVRSTGNSGGTLTIAGTGGNGSGTFNSGVWIGGSAATVTSKDGAINITGTGGTGTNDYNLGIYLRDTGVISSTGTATITLVGNGGGSGAGNDNMGVWITDQGSGISHITSVTGNISITGNAGTGSSGNYNDGVYLGQASYVESTGAATISITGVGGGTGVSGNSSGINITGGGIVRSTGNSGGSITINGTGGTGSGSGNYGIILDETSTSVTSKDGAISMIGHGGTGGDNAHGIRLQNAAFISSTGTATITLNGTGGAGAGGSNYGVMLLDNGGGAAYITSATGNISITGTGGTNTGQYNLGIDIQDASYVESTGAATITLLGTGGGSGASDTNWGIDLYNGGIVRSTLNGGGGSITITGIGGGGSGGGNVGVGIDGGAGTITSRDGAITVNGTGGAGANSYGFFSDNTAGIKIGTGGGSTTGAVTLAFDSWSVAANTAFNTTGAYTVKNYTAGGTVGVGTGAGTLSLNSTIIGQMTLGSASSLTVGSATTGAIDINYTTSLPTHTTFDTNGATITSSSNMTIGANKYLTFNDPVSLSAARTITSTTGAGQVNFLSTINGAQTFTVANNTSTVHFAGAIGGVTPLTSVTVSGSGATTIDSNVTTTGIQSYAGAVILGGNVTMTTTNSGITITGALNGTNNGSESLTTSTGTGTSTFSSTIGATKTLNNLSITSDAATFGGNISGTGTFTLRPSTDSVNMHINDGTSSGLFLNSTMQGYLQNGWADLIFGKTSLTGTLTVGASTWNDNTSFISGSGVMTISGAQTMGANNLTMQTDSNLALSADVTGTGNLTIKPSTITTTMNIGGNTNTIQLSAAEMAHIIAGWNSETFGRIDGTGAIVISANTFSDTTYIYGGAITTAGTIAPVKDLTIGSTGSVTISNAITKSSGADATLTIAAAADITTSAAITSSNNKLNVVLDADSDASGSGAIKVGGAITSNGGAITMGGGADPTTTNAMGDATNTNGVEINGVTIDAGGGNIIMRGTGRASGSNKYGVLMDAGGIIQTSGSGTISIYGTGGGSGAGTDNVGIAMFDADNKVSAVNGNITLQGTGGNTTGGGNHGIRLDGDIFGGVIVETTGTGNIAMTGNGTGGGANSDTYGIFIRQEALVRSTGVNGGSISLTGTGGTASGGADYGVYIFGYNNWAGVTSKDGNISIIGTGGSGGGDENYGVAIADGGYVTSTGNATITINGTGGANGSSGETGVSITGASVNDTTYISSVTGNISITGTAGTAAGADNVGVSIAGGSYVETTGAATITITGTGKGSGGSGFSTGVDIISGSIVRSTGNSGGSITIDGTGGQGSGDKNYGVAISASSATVTSKDGAISITGHAGTGGGNYSRGIYLADTGVVSSTGTATIDFTGYGGGSGASDNNTGVVIEDGGSGGSHITSVTGNITITGTGGSTTGAYDEGVAIGNGGVYVETTGAANIIINGTGGGSGAASNAMGFELYDGAIIRSTLNGGGGNITITGIGGTGSNGDNYGIWMDGAAAPVITSRDGDISISGLGGTGANNYGFLSDNTAGLKIGTGAGSTTGDISMIVDTWSVAANTNWNTTGNYLIRPYTAAGTTVGVAGGAGTLDINTTILGQFNLANAASMTIGATNDTGAMNVNAYTWPTNLTLITGSGLMTIAGAQALGAHNLTMQTDSDLTISANLTGTGTLTAKTSAAATTMEIQGTGQTLNISNAELGKMIAGWTSLNFGASTQTGLMKVNNYNWADNVNFINGSGEIRFTGGTSTLTANKYLTATTASGDITAPTASGGIVASGTGYITLNSGNDINFSQDFDLTAGAAAINLLAKNSIIESASGDITTSNAAITLNSDSDASGAGAISLGSGTDIASSGGAITLGGGADPTTTAAYGTASNVIGIDLQSATLNAGAGSITLHGTGYAGTGGSQYGVNMNGATLQVSGAGTISVTGTGGSNAGDAVGSDHGVRLEWSTLQSTTADGNNTHGAISITGTAGDNGGSGDNNFGVSIADGVNDISTVDGNISITGNGGTGTGITAGVVVDTSTVSTTGIGAISITGTANGTGDADWSTGVTLTNSTVQVAATGGAITLTGTGGTSGGAGAHMDGVRIDTNSLVTSVNSAITVTGTGGTGAGDTNNGVDLDIGSTISTTGSGSISITGTGGSGATAGFAYGMKISGAVQTSGTGSITLIGTGGGNVVTGNGADYGVYISWGTVQTTSADSNSAHGAITINGTAGNTSGSGSSNFGVLLDGDNNVSTADGNISITGNGGTSTGNNAGVIAYDNTIIQTTGKGGIAITGTANGTGGTGFDWGVGIQDNTVVKTIAGGGNITITGTGGDAGGAGGNNHGIGITNTASITTVSADITITGIAGTGSGGNNYGLYTDGTVNIGDNSTAGDITLVQDIWSIDTTTTAFETTGNVTIKPYTVGTDVGIGTGAGTLSISDAILGNITAGSLTIGDLTNTNDIDFNDAGRTFTFPLTLLAGRDAIMSSQLNSSANGAGNPVVVVAATRNFVNNSGAGANTIHLTGAASPSWAVYSTAAADDTNGAATLNPGSTTYSETYVSAPPSGLPAGNNWIYSSAAASGTYTWTGTTSTAWNVGTNWDLGFVPGTLDDVIINNVANDPIFDAAHTLHDMTMNAGSILDLNSYTLTLTGTFTTTNATLTSSVGNLTLITDHLALGAGTSITNAGTVTIAPYTDSTTIGVNGSAGTLQITSTDLSYISAATTVIGRSDATGLLRITGADLSAMSFGNLSLLNGSANIQFDGGGTILKFASNKNFSATTTSGDIVDSADGTIQTQGTGTITLDSGNDVNFTHDFDLTSATGAILVKAKNSILETGYGDITTSNAAVTLNSDSDASGAGAIYLAGDGGANNMTITTSGGNITLGGGADPTTTAAFGTAANVTGVTLTSATIDAGGGNISIRGQGYNTTTDNNMGVHNYYSDIKTSGAGTITVVGQGGGGSGNSVNNFGVQVNGGGFTTVNGTLSITGTGGGAGFGDGNIGVRLVQTGATIQSTGSGAIVITGTGGNSSGNSFSNNNTGVEVALDTVIQATSTGNITINGTGGDSGSGNIGISVTGSVTGAGGTMSLTGAGGNSGSDDNVGVYNRGTVSNTGNGTLTVTGTGHGTGNSASDYGVYVNTAGVFSTINGALTVTGTGGGAGTGTNNFGVYVVDANSTIKTTGSGLLTVNGVRGGGDTATNYGLKVAVASGLNTTGTGNIVVNTDTISLAQAHDINSVGTATIATYSQNGTIGINGAAGTLGLTSTYLSYIDSTTLTIGRNDGTGLMRVSGADLSADTFGNFALLNGSANIQFDGGGTALTLAANKNFSATTTSGDITAPTASGGIVTSGTGTITLNSGNDINFSQDFDLTTSTGAVSLLAKNSIIESASGDITTSNAAITLNSDSDASGAGAISLGSGTTLTSGGGNITLGGGATPGSVNAYGTASNNDGVALNGVTIAAGGGNISIRGTGYGAGVGPNNGVYIYNASDVSTTGAGTLTIVGTGGGGSGGSNMGVAITTTNNGFGTSTGVSTVNGAISITGTGGASAGDGNYGIRMLSTANASFANISASGIGTITLNGTGGGTGASAGNAGILLDGNSSVGYAHISAVSGNISVTGTGGNTSGGTNYGIHENYYSVIESTGAGNVTLNGTGGGTTGSDSYGVYIERGATVQTTSTGNVSITGQGTGTGTSANAFGIYMLNAPGAQSTGTNGGTITLDGTAGNGTGTNNEGIRFESYGAGVTSKDGNISITGHGGANGGTYSRGIYMTAGSISSTGNATITLNGTGVGAGSSTDNVGIFMNAGTGGASYITSVTGNISVTGGGGNTSGAWNEGVAIGANSYIESTGAATITINGIANGSGTNEIGVEIYDGGFVRSTLNGGGGSISITGTGGAAGSGAGNYGIWMDGPTAPSVTSRDGAITMTGIVGAGTTNGFVTDNTASLKVGATGGSATSGDITIITDAWTIAANTRFNTTGTMTIKPYTASGTIKVAGAAAGALDISTAILGHINSGTLVIGRNDGTGLMRVAGADLSADTFGHLSLLNGSANIQFDGGGTALTLATNKNFSATTTSGDIVDSAAGTIQTQGTGTITLDSGNDVNFTHDFDLTSSTGAVSLLAKNSIIESASGDITTSNAAITLNSDSDADGVNGGAISLGSGTTLTSGGGNITLGGGADPTTTAAIGTASNGEGVKLSSASLLAGGGNISVRGIGNASGGSNGIYITGTSPIQTTGTGTVSIIGTGGAGTGSNRGVNIDMNTTISTVAGNLTITGTAGAGAGSLNTGVYIIGSASALTITTQSGALSITGTGSSDGGGGRTDDYGVYVGFNTTISSTGTGGGLGAVTITGTGDSTGFGVQHGIVFDGSATVTAVDAAINMTGTGGAGDSYGMKTAAGSITSTGSSTITLTSIGHGSYAGLYNDGSALTVGGASATGSINFIQDSATWGAIAPRTTGTVTYKTYSQNGTIGVNGATGTLGVTSAILGATIAGTTVVGRSDGTGLMRVAGADLSASSMGHFNLLNGSANIQYDGGTLTLAANKTFSTATASGSFATATADGTIVTSGTGDITLDDPVSLAKNLTLTSAGTVTFGSTVDGAFDVTATAGTFSLGGAWGGVTPLGAVSLTSTNAIALPAMSADTLLVHTTGITSDITLNGTLTAASAGDAIVLASGDDFFNTVGAGVLNLTGGGRWLIYSQDPAQNTLNGLVLPLEVNGKDYAGYPPGSVTELGNVMFYSLAQDFFSFTATDVNMMYGATPVFTYAFFCSTGCTEAQVVSGGTLSLTSLGDSTSGVGAYNIVSAVGSLTFNPAYSSFAVNYVDGTLTIGQRTLTVTASNQTKTYGFGGTAAALGTTSFTSSGLQNGETIGGVTLTTNATTSTSTNYNAGVWTLSASAATGGTFDINNYDVTYVNAPVGLTINTKSLTISGMTASNKVYDGTTTATLDNSGDSLNGIVDGLANVGGGPLDVVTVDASGATGTFANKNVGNGKTVTAAGIVLAGADAANYTLTQPTTTANITPASLTVTAVNKSKTYGAADPALTYNYVGLVGGDGSASFTGGLTRVVGETVAGGPYAINQGTLTATGNYTISVYNAGTFTINPALLTVTADDMAKVTGGIDPAFTYSYTGLVNGDLSASFVGSLDRDPGETDGVYNIFQNTLTATGNYTIGTFNDGTFYINASGTVPSDSSGGGEFNEKEVIESTDDGNLHTMLNRLLNLMYCPDPDHPETCEMM